MVKKLRKMPYAHAWVKDYRDNNKDMIILQSYQTEVIIVENGFLECSGLYSMTTRKHISAFLSEYFPKISFQMVKSIANTGKKIDIWDGCIVG